ncbi:Atu2307/SP_0267 family LLM class monooxygenase [Chitinophaga nivalis]|uniref:LLM class flavin-dependent oxidoreductase n=1 Tax=Chitinophaga nivalis TaxID=2991709 RepID=A0ABT3IM98_9BACT|nr:Atu2307/SP_0267 family LLM class monooxygenase [Chitinophaga nivalis]MCW3465205.1 LLM class flavin-dependent oxidoreductase [Chitinophaga nivalis]MCW3485103.1 LLM class flavin-dependent oxidoreductase [Chitinophaga nivalis]
MELGISMFGDLHVDPVTGHIQPAQDRLRELIEEIKLADEVGLDLVGIGEHHRAEYAVSSPEIILAAAATVTKNIKLTSSVTVLSSSDPVRIYQHFAMVDLLSGGRAELVAGRGSFTESFPLFGYDLRHYDALFEEKLALLLQINKSAAINWEGRFRPALVDQQVYPRAVGNQLPVWIAAGGSPESVVRAARLGLPLVFAVVAGTPIDRFLPLYRLYKAVYQEYGHSMDTFQAGMFSHGLPGENSRSIADYYYPLYAAQMDRIGKSRGWSPFQRTQYDFGCSPKGAMFVGDANEVAEKILYAQELLGITRFTAHLDVGAPSHKHLMKAIEIFGTRVAPQVRAALAK